MFQVWKGQKDDWGPINQTECVYMFTQSLEGLQLGWISKKKKHLCGYTVPSNTEVMFIVLYWPYTVLLTLTQFCNHTAAFSFQLASGTWEVFSSQPSFQPEHGVRPSVFIMQSSSLTCSPVPSSPCSSCHTCPFFSYQAALVLHQASTHTYQPLAHTQLASSLPATVVCFLAVWCTLLPLPIWTCLPVWAVLPVPILSLFIDCCFM